MTGKDLDAIVSANVRARRLAQGLTQVQLAEATGLTQGEVSHIETGKTGTTVRTLATLAEALRTSPEKLLQPSRLAVVTTATRQPAASTSQT